MGVRQFGWDILKKGANVTLSRHNMQANRGRGTYTYESIVSELGFTRGTHYWEVTLDCYGTEEDIFVGVC
jgi:hypothetical protein